jgi:hypothetical protein
VTGWPSIRAEEIPVPTRKRKFAQVSDPWSEYASAVVAANKTRLRWKEPKPAQWDKFDYEANLEIEQSALRLLGRHIATDESTPGLVRFDGLRVGEVTRHFETWTAGEIDGWVQHQLVGGFHGWGNVLSGGDLRQSSFSLSGSSQIELNIAARSGTDLTSDSFLAVFDRPLPDGDIDTVRLVVPSEGVCRQLVETSIVAMGSLIAPRSWRDLALRGLAPMVAASVNPAGSYAGDKLSAYARNSGAERPPVSILGAELSHHSYFGAAIRFGDGDWLELFPAALIAAFKEMVAEISSKHGVPVGLRL